MLAGLLIGLALLGWAFENLEVVIPLALLLGVLCNGSNGVVEKLSNSFDDKIISQKNLPEYCKDGEAECIRGLKERVVRINSNFGSGTGFIMESDDTRMLVITASHVIRKGNGTNSYIADPIVYDVDTGKGAKSTKSCAYFTKSYGDIALIEVPNHWKKKFDRIPIGFDASADDEVLVVDNKFDYKRTSRFTISRFGDFKSGIALFGLGEKGMSGAPIISKQGQLLGVLTSGNSYNGQDYIYGTRRLLFSALVWLDSLASQESGKNHICVNETHISSL